MWLTEIFNRLFPPPPLAPDPDLLQKQRDADRIGQTRLDHRRHDAIFGEGCVNVAEGRYLLQEDLDKLRSSLRNFDF